MGFLDNIFGKEPEKKTIKSIELKDWLEEISSEVLEETNQDINEIFSDIEEAKQELHNRLDELEEAELMNKKIPDREIHVMEGNRDNYIKQTYHFVEGLNLPKQDYDEIEEFTEDFTKLLEKFNKSTGKSYYVLKNYFDTEMKEIAGLLRDIEDYVGELRDFVQGDLVTQYRNLFSKIRKLNESVVKSEKLTQEISSLEEDLNATKQKKDKLKEKMSKLKEGENFSQFNKIEKKRKEVDEDIDKLDKKLLSRFKKLERYLKKQVHGTEHEELVKSYLNDPIGSLEDDKKLEITDVLDKLKKGLRDVEIKKKEEDKLRKTIKKLDEEHLKKIRNKNEKLKDKKKKLNEKIKKNTVMVDYKDYEYQQEHADEKIERLEKEIKEKKSQLDDLKLDKKSDRLEKELSEFSGYDVEVIA